MSVFRHWVIALRSLRVEYFTISARDAALTGVVRSLAFMLMVVVMLWGWLSGVCYHASLCPHSECG